VRNLGNLIKKLESQIGIDATQINPRICPSILGGCGVSVNTAMAITAAPPKGSPNAVEVPPR